jgi:hypothetical protein
LRRHALRPAIRDRDHLNAQQLRVDAEVLLPDEAQPNEP